MKKELKSIGEDLGNPYIREVFEYFFKNPGKLLRPTLVFLSAGVLNRLQSDSVNHLLVQLAIAVELIHSSSLIHDDIIDGDQKRRGQKTLNNAFGNKIAVWAGDALYTRAFSILSGMFPKDFAVLMIQVTKNMSTVEIQQAISKTDSLAQEKYIELIRGKTALLMGACCRLGGSLAGAGEKEKSDLENFGINFGMVYQIIDDYLDNDPLRCENVGLEEAHKYALDAKYAVKDFDDSIYKESLIALVDYVLSFSNS